MSHVAQMRPYCNLKSTWRFVKDSCLTVRLRWPTVPTRAQQKPKVQNSSQTKVLVNETSCRKGWYLPTLLSGLQSVWIRHVLFYSSGFCGVVFLSLSHLFFITKTQSTTLCLLWYYMFLLCKQLLVSKDKTVSVLLVTVLLWPSYLQPLRLW